MRQKFKTAGFRIRLGPGGDGRLRRTVVASASHYGWVPFVAGATVWLMACGGRNTGRPEFTGGASGNGGASGSGGSPLDSGPNVGGSPTVDGSSGGAAPGPDAPVLGEWCSDANGLEFQNILNFETPTARCDPAVAPTTTMQTSCLYFNYDSDTEPLSCHNGATIPVVHSPPLCSIPQELRPPENCLLPNGQAAGAVRCAQSNIVGGTVPTEAIDGTRCGTSHWGMHLVASDLGICMNQITGALAWGAGLSLTFFPDSNGYPTDGFDASAWDGISFWVRRGTGPSLSVFYTVVKDPFTDRATALPAALMPPPPRPECQKFIPTFCDSGNVVYASPTGGGACSPTVPDYCKCDGFWVGIGMTDQWHFIMLPFADMNQKGYGVPSPLGRLDTSHITSLQFSFGSQAALGGSWDLWIDDVAFYRKAR
jgi:hypothetical protein